MKLTDEQKQIVAHQGDLVVSARAGSGKTSTIVEYVKARPREAILYCAFNKTVKDEAISKFAKIGINNVTVHTGHSLGYSAVMAGRRLTLHSKGSIRPHDVLEWHNSGVEFKSDLHKLIFAKHVVNVLNAYCNSDVEKVHHIDHVANVHDEEGKHFLNYYIDEVEDAAALILKRMWAGDLPMVHAAYLKQFQLMKPDLPYSTVIIDEAQDSNPCLLDIFLRQKGTKVLVGDDYQSIYSFTGALNALGRVKFPRKTLTNSFRFGQDIADQAMSAIQLKQMLGINVSDFSIRGLGNGKIHGKATQAVVARSNLGLIGYAIQAVEDKIKISFEGDLSNYTFMSSGISVYDVLNLYCENHDRINDEFLKQFKDYKSLIAYQSSVEDQELGLVINLINTYGAKLFGHIKDLKNKSVSKDDADVILTSTHKSKGLDYHYVNLADDFITGKKIKKRMDAARKRGEVYDIENASEEINLLYVAITRAMVKCSIPFEIEL